MTRGRKIRGGAGARISSRGVGRASLGMTGGRRDRDARISGQVARGKVAGMIGGPSGRTEGSKTTGRIPTSGMAGKASRLTGASLGVSQKTISGRSPTSGGSRDNSSSRSPGSSSLNLEGSSGRGANRSSDSLGRPGRLSLPSAAIS